MALSCLTAQGREPGVSLCQAQPAWLLCRQPSPAARARGRVSQPASPFMVSKPPFGLQRPANPHPGREFSLTQGSSQSRPQRFLAELLLGTCFCFKTCVHGQSPRPHSSHRPGDKENGPKGSLILHLRTPTSRRTISSAGSL